MVRTPVTILKEQASLLGTKTKGLLGGVVQTRAWSGSVYHSFSIVVPSLDGYTYQLFEVGHLTTDLYPVEVGGVALQTEQQFIDWLGEQLSSPETKKIIGNLLAQANS